MKFLTTTLTAAAVVCAGGMASAATLDFVAEAAGNERGVEDGTTLNIGGFDITFSAGRNNEIDGPPRDNFAYFDDLSGGKPGGLGVCTVLDSDKQCAPSSDDNVSEGEWVRLVFDDIVNLSKLSFNDADHKDIDPDGVFKLKVDGDATVLTFGAASAGTYVGKVFRFDYLPESRGGEEFYIAGGLATVPLPAAGWLLLAGLGGLAATKRRKS